MKNQLLFEFLRVKYGPPLQKLEFHFCILCGGREGSLTRSVTKDWWVLGAAALCTRSVTMYKRCNTQCICGCLGLLYVQEVLLCTRSVSMYQKCYYVQEVLLCTRSVIKHWWVFGAAVCTRSALCTRSVWRCGSCSMYQFLLPDFDSSGFLIL